MKKLAATLLAVILMFSLACPAFAQESTFIPSNGMEVLSAELDSKDVKDCVVVSSVTQAKNNETDVAEDSLKLLVELYDALSANTEKLPVEGEFRYIEMSDVSFAEAACIQNEEHMNDDKQTKNDVLEDSVLAVEFKLENVPEEGLMALAYVDGEWKVVENLTNLGDDKISCELEACGPVVFIESFGGSEVPASGNVPGSTAASGVSGEFVPSITYKDGLSITKVETNMVIDGKDWSEGIKECVEITSIAQAKEKSTDLSQEDRDFLLEVYEDLANGDMLLPLPGDYVIRDLVDISFKYENCTCDEEHGHKDECLADDGVTLTITFDMGVAPDAKVTVMTYIDNSWKDIKSVVNNGDGTVTCVFEDICPVAFVVDDNVVKTTPFTGDTAGQQLPLYAGTAVASAAGIALLMVLKRKLVA